MHRKYSALGDPQRIYDFYWMEELQFSRELLTRYCLSLQTKPFVILTGISGTGKTKIAQIFADYLTQDLGEEERKKRIAFVPVRPDWMDNRGLLGYYNPLTNTYQSTPVLRLLLAAAKQPDKPYFVILDEMNLAKVEYYFSDFLSILESRTYGQMKGEDLRLHDQGDTVESDSQTDNVNGGIPARLHIPANVYFTGTVNVDESTYMFSPKVLDRANVIEFNEVDLDGYCKKQETSTSFTLANPKVEKHFSNVDRRPFCSQEDFNKYKKLLERKSLDGGDPLAKLFQTLRPYHLHFGYRVINEIARFVVLAQEQVEGFDLDQALDIQFLQKILPKLHGTQGRLQGPLSDILAFCYDTAELGEDRIRRAATLDVEARYPRTAQKVARMLSALKEQGYVSFIE